GECRIAVSRLRAPRIVARAKEQHRFGARGLHAEPRVGADHCPAAEDAEQERLEMGEATVRSFDREHGVPRLAAIALEERVDCEGAPVVRAKLEQGDRLVDAAHPAGALAAHLHHDARRAVHVLEHGAGALEVGIGVEAASNAFDGQLEDSGVQSLLAAWHCSRIAAPVRQGKRSACRAYFTRRGAVIASGSRMRSNSCLVNRLRSTTTSYTPNPVSSASLATAVAFS